MMRLSEKPIRDYCLCHCMSQGVNVIPAITSLLFNQKKHLKQAEYSELVLLIYGLQTSADKKRKTYLHPMTKQPNFAPWSTAWTIFQFYILSKPPLCKMSVRFINDSLSGDRPAPEDITAHNMRPSSVGKGVATIVGGGGRARPGEGPRS